MFGSVVHISIATGQGDVKVAGPSVPWVCEESDLPAAQRPSPERLGLTVRVAAFVNGMSTRPVGSSDHCEDCRHVEVGNLEIPGDGAPEEPVKLGEALAVPVEPDLETTGVVRLGCPWKLTSKRVAEGWGLLRWNA